MPDQISVRALQAKLTAGEPVYLVDVRQPWEHEVAALPGTHVLVPLAELVDRHDEITPPDGALVVAYCHHGIRSLNAAALLERAGHSVASLAGGIDRWSLEIDPKIPRY